MWDLKVCTVCFSTGVKLYSLNIGTLRKDFNLVSGLHMVKGQGMPEYLCVECSAYVRKFKKFRDKCHRAHFALNQILIRNKEIKKSNIKLFNRQHLNVEPTLSYVDLGKCHYEQIQFKLVNYCRSSIPQLRPIPVAHYSTLTKEDTFESEMKDVTNEVMQSYVKIENAPQINNVANEFSQNMPGILSNDNVNSIASTILKNILGAKEEFPICTHANSLEHNDINKVENDAFAHDNNEMDESDSECSKFELMSCKLNNKVDGSHFNEEYGEIVPISVKEAKAAVEVNKYCSVGDYQCDCGKKFVNAKTVAQHSRRHDKHIYGNFHCEICDFYFRTAFLLQCHMTDHHMYKYLCKQCPEVTFSRSAAKNHYVFKHFQGEKQQVDEKPWDILKKSSWQKNTKRTKGTFNSKLKNLKKVPKDFPIRTPIPQVEQYLMVEQRKDTRNYIEAKYKCELCYRGYRLTSTYNKHMAKHDPVVSGNHQCDMCKHYFRDTRRLYKHMITYHIHKFSCRYCDFVCTSKGQALYHYRWHKNVTYDCPHCDKKFTKISTQLTHIRFKHPGTDICNLCGHSFVSSSGLNCHKQMSHSKEEIEISEAMAGHPTSSEPYYCTDCKMQFLNEQAYITHLGSSRKHVVTNLSVIRHERANRRTERLEARGGGGGGAGRGRARAPRDKGGSEVLNTGTTTATNCEVCGLYLASDVVARKHYEAHHPGTDYLKRYMCDVCGHTTKQYANLLVHMRVHTQEKPYGCPHCDRRFSMPSNRDRHLVVHTGEKRYQCQHCSRRFTQSTAVKLHIQTVHMKIPYKPWDKKNRKRRKEAEPTTAGLEVIPPPVSESLVAVPQHKLLLDAQGEYITYISYADEQ